MGATIMSTALLRAADQPSASARTLSPVDLSDLINLHDVEAAARRHMSSMAYEYVASGAGDELTLRWNLERFQEIRLRPRLLTDVSQLDPSLELFGQRLTMPILLAPTANHRLVHPEAELATARGAGMAGAAMVLSSGANTDIRDVARVATAPLWFQLYVQPDRSLTKDMVQHAEDAGASAICITVDSPVDGVRNRERRARMKLPPGTDHPNYLGRRTEPRSISTINEVRPQKLDWELIAWLRSISRTPLLLKGILSPEDAEQAIRVGVAGIIVSNHGGRALDTVPATIDALPAVVERVAGRLPVLMDGGIRRGTDVLKALACGATATLVGRPYVYGLAVGGAEGVAHVLKTLRQEFLIAMALAGRSRLADIDRTVLW